MRVQGELGIAPRRGLAAKNRTDVQRLAAELGGFIEEVQHEERRHLIIARTRRVDLLARRTHSSDELEFDPRVQIFALGVRSKSVAALRLTDGMQRLLDGVVLRRVQHFGLEQHSGVRGLQLEFVRQQEPISLQAAVQRVQIRMQRCLPFPERTHGGTPRFRAGRRSRAS